MNVNGVSEELWTMRDEGDKKCCECEYEYMWMWELWEVMWEEIGPLLPFFLYFYIFIFFVIFFFGFYIELKHVMGWCVKS